MRKEEIRKKVLAQRLSLTKEEVNNKSKLIVSKIKSDTNYQQSFRIGLYMPIKNEVNLLELLNDSNHTFYIPRINEFDELEFSRLDCLDNLKPGKYHILESTSLEVSIPDYLLIPALAISKTNDRVGYGKAYYDRYLKNHDVKYKVGVIYAFQEIDHISTQSQDIKLDYYFKE